MVSSRALSLSRSTPMYRMAKCTKPKTSDPTQFTDGVIGFVDVLEQHATLPARVGKDVWRDMAVAVSQREGVTVDDSVRDDGDCFYESCARWYSMLLVYVLH